MKECIPTLKKEHKIIWWAPFYDGFQIFLNERIDYYVNMDLLWPFEYWFKCSQCTILNANEYFQSCLFYKYGFYKVQLTPFVFKTVLNGKWHLAFENISLKNLLFAKMFQNSQTPKQAIRVDFELIKYSVNVRHILL